jgi:hypothetical protein
MPVTRAQVGPRVPVAVPVPVAVVPMPVPRAERTPVPPFRPVPGRDGQDQQYNYA